MELNYKHVYLLISGEMRQIQFNNYVQWSVAQQLGSLASFSVRTRVKILQVANDTQLAKLVDLIIQKTDDGKQLTIRDTELIRRCACQSRRGQHRQWARATCPTHRHPAGREYSGTAAWIRAPQSRHRFEARVTSGHPVARVPHVQTGLCWQGCRRNRPAQGFHRPREDRYHRHLNELRPPGASLKPPSHP